MFCSKCGKESSDDARFCSSCGNSLEVTVGSSAETETKATPRQIVSRCMLAVIWILIGTGVIWFSLNMIKQNKHSEEAQREATIANTLIRLGNRSFGSSDINTAQYSMALSFVSNAALSESTETRLKDASSEEVKKDAFKMLERYFESDYDKTYAALLFGADYFDKDDIEYFYNGTKVNAHQMKMHVEDMMFRNNISLATLLVDKEDERICMNLSLRIKMAEDGYLSTEDIISDLYDFTYGGVGLKTVSDEKLQEGITYEELTRDFDEAFEGSKVYYEDLSPVGKMVFLYIIPRCVVQFDQEAGSELWYYYFMDTYEAVWNSIIHRDIFEKVVEFSYQ